MKTIWKFPLEMKDVQEVIIPSSAKILDVQLPGGVLCLWALVNLARGSSERRSIVIVGTGTPVPEGRFEHIATVQHGMFVWHVFEAVSD